MNTPHKFIHTFANGITGTLVFDPSEHYWPESRKIKPAKSWSRQPTDKDYEAMFAEYREWLHTVHSEIAVIIDSEHAYLLQDSFANPPFWEFWVYRPSGEKECVKKDIGIFDPRTMGRDDLLW